MDAAARATAEIEMLWDSLTDPRWDSDRYRSWARGRISGIQFAMGWETHDSAT